MNIYFFLFFFNHGEQSNVKKAMLHIVAATTGQTSRSAAVSQLKYVLGFIGCCLSLYPVMQAVSECAFLAMVLKAWLNSMQN